MAAAGGFPSKPRRSPTAAGGFPAHRSLPDAAGVRVSYGVAEVAVRRARPTNSGALAGARPARVGRALSNEWSGSVSRSYHDGALGVTQSLVWDVVRIGGIDDGRTFSSKDIGCGMVGETQVERRQRETNCGGHAAGGAMSERNWVSDK